MSVPEVAQVVGARAHRRDSGGWAFQRRHTLKPVREAVIRRKTAAARNRAPAPSWSPAWAAAPTQVIVAPWGPEARAPANPKQAGFVKQPGVGIIQRRCRCMPGRLSVPARSVMPRAAPRMPAFAEGAEIQRVESQGRAQPPAGPRPAARLAKQRGLEMAGGMVPAQLRSSVRSTRSRARPGAAGRGKTAPARSRPRPARRRSRSPCRRRRRLRVASLHIEGQAQVVVRFAVIGVGVAPGQALRWPAGKTASASAELAAAQKQPAHRVVAAAVERVAPQGFLVIGLGRIGGVAILFQVQAVQEKLFVARDLCGGRAGVAGAGIARLSGRAGAYRRPGCRRPAAWSDQRCRRELLRARATVDRHRV